MKIKESENNFEKFKRIKLFVMDCDGVMTDGGIFINRQGESFKRFDVKDGLGIKLLHLNRINTACISGSNSSILEIRAKSLGIKIIHCGIDDKLTKLKKIQAELKINKQETIFLGDDVNDLRVIEAVSIFAVPKDAHESCKKKADFIGTKKGGGGFIREIIDYLLLTKGIDPYLPQITTNDFDI